MRKIFLLLIILLLVSPVFAQVPDYQDKYVNDFANVFNANQTSELRLLFSITDQQTTAEITLLTVDTVASMAMNQYAQEVFDKWKIGKADKDNGLLILYAKQEDKIWVSTGYGLGGILPDSKVGRILDETFVPARANNDSASGIILAAKEYASVINDNADEVRSGNAGPSDNINIFFNLFIIMMFFIFPFFAFIVNIIFTPKCKKCNCRMKLIDTKTVIEKQKGAFGIMQDIRYIIKTYKCPKCGCLVIKKTKMKNRTLLPLILLASSRRGFGSSGGFGGGGFGGGGGGGGGAGR